MATESYSFSYLPYFLNEGAGRWHRLGLELRLPLPPQLTHSLTHSQQIKIIQLVPIPQDAPFHLAPLRPRHRVLQAARHQERRIRHDVRAHAHVALRDEPVRGADRGAHLQPRHHDAEAAAAEGGHGDFAGDVAELGSGGRRRGQNAHVGELVEEEGGVFGAEGIMGREEGEEVREVPEGAAEAVVGGVGGGGGEGVAAGDGVREVAGIGFVGCEVDFAEESGREERRLIRLRGKGGGEEGEEGLLLVVFEFADHGGGGLARESFNRVQQGV